MDPTSQMTPQEAATYLKSLQDPANQSEIDQQSAALLYATNGPEFDVVTCPRCGYECEPEDWIKPGPTCDECKHDEQRCLDFEGVFVDEAR